MSNEMPQTEMLLVTSVRFICQMMTRWASIKNLFTHIKTNCTSSLWKALLKINSYIVFIPYILQQSYYINGCVQSSISAIIFCLFEYCKWGLKRSIEKIASRPYEVRIWSWAQPDSHRDRHHVDVVVVSRELRRQRLVATAVALHHGREGRHRDRGITRTSRSSHERHSETNAKARRSLHPETDLLRFETKQVKLHLQKRCSNTLNVF